MPEPKLEEAVLTAMLNYLYECLKRQPGITKLRFSDEQHTWAPAKAAAGLMKTKHMALADKDHIWRLLKEKAGVVNSNSGKELRSAILMYEQKVTAQVKAQPVAKPAEAKIATTRAEKMLLAQKLQDIVFAAEGLRAPEELAKNLAIEYTGLKPETNKAWGAIGKLARTGPRGIFKSGQYYVPLNDTSKPKDKPKSAAKASADSEAQFTNAFVTIEGLRIVPIIQVGTHFVIRATPGSLLQIKAGPLSLADQTEIEITITPIAEPTKE